MPGIDAEIPLQVRPQQPINPFGDIMQIMQLKQAQQLLPLKLQEAQQNIQESKLKLDAATTEAQERLAIKQAIQENGGDIEKALPKILQVAPTHGLAFATAARQAQQEQLKATGEKLKNAITSTELGARVLQGVPDAADPEAAYHQSIKVMQALGLDHGQMSPTYDPQQVQQYIQSGLSTKDQLAKKQTELKDKLEAMGRTKVTAEGIMQQNPATGAFDIKVGEPEKAGAPTVHQDEQGNFHVINPNGISAPVTENGQPLKGKPPGEGDRNPTEASLAMTVAAGKVPGASVEAVKASQKAEFALRRLDQSRLNSRPITMPPGSVPLNPTQQSIADKLATGDFNPAQLTRFPDKESLIAGAIAKNPNWSPQTFATKKAFEDPQSKQSQNLGTISRIVGHIGRFEKNSKELGVSPSFFTGVNLTGKAAATQEDAHAISAELEKLVSGGVGTEGQVQTWQKSLTSSNPEIRQQAVDEISQLIGSQYEGMNQTFKTTLGTDLPLGKYVTAAGRDWMKKKGIQVSGEGASPSSGGQGKIVVTAPDGSTHPFDTQAQADAFKKLAHIP